LDIDGPNRCLGSVEGSPLAHDVSPLDPLKGAFDFVEEDFAQAGDFAFIEARALEKLSPCQKMPGDPSHFRRERSSRRTPFDGMGVTSPLSISR
jgi:hypothetical protein